MSFAGEHSRCISTAAIVVQEHFDIITLLHEKHISPGYIILGILVMRLGKARIFALH